MERYLQQLLRSTKFEGVSPQRSKTMQAVKGKGNKTTELRLRMALIRARVSGWVLHESSIPGKPDFFFSESKLAVFVDGCFWHGCKKCGHTPYTRSSFWAAKFERTKSRDRRTRRLLRKNGIAVISFWEHQIKTSTGLRAAVNRVVSQLGQLGNQIECL
jgi:DNA mismatch endonuclease (patch repair protein)